MPPVCWGRTLNVKQKHRFPTRAGSPVIISRRKCDQSRPPRSHRLEADEAAQEIVSCGFFALGEADPRLHHLRVPTGVMAMKRWVIAGAGVLWMAAVSSAGAADIPAAPVVKAPVAVPAAQSWYGFYIGANGGYAWGNNSVEFTPDAFYGPFLLGAGVPGSLASKPQGWLGGITNGSNYQFNNLVIGLDSDFDWSNIKASQPFNGSVTGVPFTTTASHERSEEHTSELQ